MHFRIVLMDLCHKKNIKNNEHGKSDRIFIAFCKLLIISGAMGLKLSRVLEVLVKRKSDV